MPRCLEVLWSSNPARRAEGWLLVVRPGLSGWEFSAAAVNGAVSEVKRLSAEEATIEQVVEAIVGTDWDTEVEHVFVGLMEIATGWNCPAASDLRGHDAVPTPIPEPIDHLRERRPDRHIASPRASRKTRTIAGGGDLRS